MHRLQDIQKLVWVSVSIAGDMMDTESTQIHTEVQQLYEDLRALRFRMNDMVKRYNDREVLNKNDN